MTQIAEDTATGYILEVDLEYHKVIHDSHIYYPVASKRKVVSKKELSRYSRQMIEDMG